MGNAAITTNVANVASAASTAKSAAVEMPSILSANTYYWKAGASADNRRRSEERNQKAVADFFNALGFEVSRSGDNVIADGKAGKDELHIVFHYSESCKNVYKTLSVARNGKNSNISAIKKLVA